MITIFWGVVPLGLLLTEVTTAQTTTVPDTKQEIAIITSVKTIGKEMSIDANFVQMLTGKAAIKAAKKAGDAEYDINAKGDTAWYVFNDYYISNSSNITRKFTLAPNTLIYLVKEGSSILMKTNTQKLKQGFEGKLFRLTFIATKLMRIEEIYTP